MKRTSALEALLHPIVLVALAVWLVNDHYLKAAYHNTATGKLSDIACLVVAPLVPLAIVEVVRGGPVDPRWHLVALGFIAFVMVSIRLFDWAAWTYRHGLGLLQWPFQRGVWTGDWPSIQPVSLTMDPTDILTLPALYIPYRLLDEPAIRGRSRD